MVRMADVSKSYMCLSVELGDKVVREDGLEEFILKQKRLLG